MANNNSVMIDLFGSAGMSIQKRKVMDSIAALTGLGKAAIYRKFENMSMAELLEIEQMNKQAALFAVDYQTELDLPLFG